jgi:3-oxoacyl-[acyl-carrier-protein] synthase-3
MVALPLPPDPLERPLKFENVCILSAERVEAPHEITSTFLMERLAPTTSRLGIDPGLLEGLTGIKARRFWDKGVQPSQVAAEAGRKAIEAAGIDRLQVGALANTSVCRDYIEPSTACLVHDRLKMPPDCINFDIGNACLAFLNGMDLLSMMIDRGDIDYALVVDGEGSRIPIEATIGRLLDPECTADQFRQQFATLTLGSGAAAMVLGRVDKHPEGHRYLGGVAMAATEHCRLCLGNPDEMITDTRPLLMEGLKLAMQTWGRAVAVMGWSPDVLDQFVMHQVSQVHTQQLSQLAGLDLAKIHKIFPRMGNIGPAGIPFVLSEAAELGRMKRGDRVALMGIGSGLNCSMSEVVW